MSLWDGWPYHADKTMPQTTHVLMVNTTGLFYDTICRIGDGGSYCFKRTIELWKWISVYPHQISGWDIAGCTGRYPIVCQVGNRWTSDLWILYLWYIYSKYLENQVSYKKCQLRHSVRFWDQKQDTEISVFFTPWLKEIEVHRTHQTCNIFLPQELNNPSTWQNTRCMFICLFNPLRCRRCRTDLTKEGHESLNTIGL